MVVAPIPRPTVQLSQAGNTLEIAAVQLVSALISDEGSHLTIAYPSQSPIPFTHASS